MPPRRGQAHGVLVGGGRGRQAAETYTQRELRKLQARMEAMERRNSESIDTSDEEESSEEEQEEIANKTKSIEDFGESQ